MIMTTKSKTKKVPGEHLPEVALATAEKVLRDIAKRNGETIRKRRSVTLKELQGDGYAVIEPMRNLLLAGGDSGAQDGCGLSLGELAERYRDADGNTPWQNIVIKAILADKISG